MKRRLWHVIMAGIMLFGLASIAACSFEIDTRVYLSDDSLPPTFKMTGSGYVAVVFVEGPFHRAEFPEPEIPFETDTSRPKYTIWQLEPLDEAPVSRTIIKYGDVPAGFTQIFPREGNPPELIEGKYYFLTVPSHSANGGGIFFTIQNGRAMAVHRRSDY